MTDLPLRSALKRLLLLSAAGTLLLMALAASLYEWDSADRRLRADIAPTLAITANSLAPALSFSDRAAAEAVLAELERDARFRAAVVLDRDGQRQTTHISSGYPDFVFEPSWLQSPAMSRFGELLLLRETVSLEGETLGTLITFHALPSAGERLMQYAPYLLSSMVALGLMSLLLFRLVNVGIIRPAQQLAGRARALSGTPANVGASSGASSVAGSGASSGAISDIRSGVIHGAHTDVNTHSHPNRQVPDTAALHADQRADGGNEIAGLQADIERMIASLLEREDGLRDQRMRLQMALDAAAFGVWEVQLPDGALQGDAAMRRLLGLDAQAPLNLTWFLDRLDMDEAHRVHALLSGLTGSPQPGLPDDLAGPDTSSAPAQMAGQTQAGPAQTGLAQPEQPQPEQPQSFTAQTVEFDCRYQHPDGRCLTLQWVGRRWPGGPGPGYRLVGVLRDITESEATRARLRLREQELRDVIQHAPIAMAVNNPAGDLIQLNRAFEQLFGYHTADLPNVSQWWPLAYPDPEYRALIREEWQDYERRAAGNPWQEPMHARVRCADGRDRQIRFTVSVLSSEQMVTCFIDETDQLRAEMALVELNATLEQHVRERTRELEIANRELEGFSYSVSHDLRAPLRAISGFSQALSDDYRDRLDDTGRLYLDRVQHATRRMGQLIDDLLHFSRLSRTALHQEPVALDALIRSSWADVPDHERCRLDMPDAPVPDCVGDEALLRQVLFNLMSNAVKFSAGREQPVVRWQVEQQEPDLVISISDNGVGFDMAYAGKLFGVFQRLHKQEEFEGTGVGLALSRRIIERHGGRIEADGRPGEGATFRLTLPRRRIAENAAPPHAYPVDESPHRL